MKCLEPARFDRSSPITVGSWGIDLENSRRTPRETARLSVEDVRRLKLIYESQPGNVLLAFSVEGR